ncbi:L-aspartate oxidase [Evansella vedderi]|uniref:L-aspartate oxidase n=1 Tax=Evansella vedderi TaxID=38282 RepID=A0ABT9ZSL5_9BACI|nr:L-aspartate oxidase [Evansella vedderi]MDQ0254179.1 L-aspartate oxidase [Evansella vedderi]
MSDKQVIIVGSGMAALITAVRLSKEKNVKLFTKNFSSGGNSWRAQGGMAAAIHEQDHPFDHLQDTLEAGCFHNDSKMVSILVEEGVVRTKKWIEQGMVFDKKNGDFSLGMEGAHRKRRILHAGGDQTGFHWMTFLHEQIAMQSNLLIYEKEAVIDFIVEEGECKGVLTKDGDGEIREYLASATILATGGCGGIFEATSNDPTIIGDGIAMAYRAGAAISDMEFMQFHPTLIKYNGKVIGLASEALRGEGARLVDSSGKFIMEGKHPLKDLAPRDVVARVIEQETKQGNQIYLDINPIKDFENCFPAIYSMCKNSQIPLEEGKIPVTIGAHFLMGGVMTDSVGRTTIPRLFAVGEVARTGVHGANRLASNSLLEALVFSERTAEFILQTHSQASFNGKKGFVKGGIRKPSYSSLHPYHTKGEIRKRATYALGVERNGADMGELIRWLESSNQIDLHINNDRSQWTNEEIQCSNMLITTWLMASSAYQRTESIGAHFRVDYPTQDKRKWLGKQIMRELETDIRLKRVGRGASNEQAIT